MSLQESGGINGDWLGLVLDPDDVSSSGTGQSK